MKDLVANRKHLKLIYKTKLLYITWIENGLFWTMYLTLYYLSSSISEWAYVRMNQLRVKRNLPGINSIPMNYEIWQNWDWQNEGEEWTQSTEWKRSLIDNVLLKYMIKGGRILEIGPGAGRWTKALQRIASHLIAVDISDQCIRICKRKFTDCSNIELYVNNGSDLPFIEDDSIDCIWSFDVFVHINACDTEYYFKEFKRILRVGGYGVIHHGQNGSVYGGWRSDLTSESFVTILEANGFRVFTQFAEWRDEGRQFRVGRYDDVITVFTKLHQ